MSASDSESSRGSDDVFDLDRIRQLIALMKEHDLGEIDLRQGEQQIRLGRASVVTSASLPLAAAAAPAPPAAAAPEPAESTPENIAIIRSPMVGTFYAGPNPKAPAFVNKGDRVQADTTVCIVEAMKTFNEIPAEISGTIVEVLVENEDAVDYGRPLFKVDTSA